MSVLANNETNSIDDAVYKLKKSIPEQIRAAIALYFKYGRIVSEKIDSLSKSEERHRIRGVKNFDSISSLTFDKQIYLFDKDLYIDFINEISRIPNQNSFSFYENETDDWRTSTLRDHMNGNSTANITLSNIKLRYMLHPFTGISKLKNSWNLNYTKIPLIKATPTIYFDNMERKKEYDNDGATNYGLFKKDMSSFGIGAGEEGIRIEVSIDIESLFETIYTLSWKKYDRKYCNRPNDFIKKLKDLTPEEIKATSDLIFEDLSPRVFYSATTTYLALVSKLVETKMDFFSGVANDILNSCRSTMYDNFDSNGDELGLTEGNFMRNMALNIRDIFDATLILDYNNLYNKTSSHFNIIKNMLSYLFSLKYETYNFIKVPGHNLKHKNLISIGILAKSQAGLLKKENALDLSLAYQHKTEGSGLGNFFLPLKIAKVEGIFAVTKRMYDCGKDFLDTFSRFIIIKKRMADSAAFNFKDGTTVDKIGKNYSDYRAYLTETYKELKKKITILSDRVNAIIKGRNNLGVLYSDIGNKETSIIKNINTVVYGITAETIPGMNFDYYEISDDNMIDSSILDDGETKKINCNPNDIINDINLIYKYLNANRSSKYLDNSSIASEFADTKYAPLVTSWLKMNQTLGDDIIDLPFRNLKINLSIIIHDSMNYGITSINEMSPNVDALDPSVIQNRNYDLNDSSLRCINESVSTFGGEIDTEDDIYAVEDLREKFEDFKKSVEEYEEENADEDLFGLFNDFMGVPCGNDITAKELKMENEVSENPMLLSNESYIKERDELIKLKKEYDVFIGSKF